MNSPTFFWLISFQHYLALSAPTKLLSLSHWILFTLSRLPIDHLSASIKQCVSIFLIISIWMARLAKHVKRAPYRFNAFFLYLIGNGPNMSTSQWVNKGYSFSLSCGKSAIICSPTLPLSLLRGTRDDGDKPRDVSFAELNFESMSIHWLTSEFSLISWTLFATKILNLFELLLM